MPDFDSAIPSPDRTTEPRAAALSQEAEAQTAHGDLGALRLHFVVL